MRTTSQHEARVLMLRENGRDCHFDRQSTSEKYRFEIHSPASRVAYSHAPITQTAGLEGLRYLHNTRG